jgi:membrane-anchored protein YejM (alkaline phosphatase superfamily)
VFNAGDYPLANIRRLETDSATQRRKLDLLAALDRGNVAQRHANDEVDAAISNYELAFRMQASVPHLASLDGESESTKALYGLDSKDQHTATFGRNCLLARRLLERGVRFIELTCPAVGHDRWDQHGNLKQGHEDNARAVDQPIGGLLTDLEQRGLLSETLVVWSGEFGRTPFAQGSDGRDHNPFGFSLWMCGGGIRGGTVYGATDEYGYKVVENRTEIHDLHATMLHLLGMDHERLTFRYSGRDMRLTDVHGKLISGILS